MLCFEMLLQALDIIGKTNINFTGFKVQLHSFSSIEMLLVILLVLLLSFF